MGVAELSFRCRGGGGSDVVVGLVITEKFIREALGGAEVPGGEAGRGEQRAGTRTSGRQRSWRGSTLGGRRKAGV